MLFPYISSVSCFLLHMLSVKHMQNQIKGKGESLMSFSSFLWKKKIIYLQQVWWGQHNRELVKLITIKVFKIYPLSTVLINFNTFSVIKDWFHLPFQTVFPVLLTKASDTLKFQLTKFRKKFLILDSRIEFFSSHLQYSKRYFQNNYLNVNLMFLKQFQY